MRLVQLLGDSIEELWEFPDKTGDLLIVEWYKEYIASDYDLFDEFMEDKYPGIECNRKFVDEIYI